MFQELHGGGRLLIYLAGIAQMVMFLLFVVTIFSVAITIGLCQGMASAANGEIQIRWTLAICAIFLGGIWLWYFASYSSQDSKANREAEELARRCSDSSMAYVMSQNFVKRQLKAPSTASFPSGVSQFAVAVGECKFIIESYVDSQNSFGAMVRSNYSATMEYLPKENSWRAHSLRID